MTSYYAVAGSNGFGVYDDYHLVKKAMNYLKNAYVKKYDKMYDAYREASEYYNSYQDDVDTAWYGLSSDIEVNWLLFRNQIRERNEEDYI